MICRAAKAPFAGLWTLIFLALPGVILVSVTAQPAAVPSRQFPPGLVRKVQDLPVGRFRSDLERLPPSARDRAVAWLGRFHFTEGDLASLQVDAEGGVFYADHFEPSTATVPTSEPVIGEAAVPVSPFPASLRFHSRPGAPNVIYLDFDGEDVSGTAWNTSTLTLFAAVAFSTDPDYSTFSDAEQTAIRGVCFRIAEDYAPFNVDVTTERPASLTTRTAHVLITRSKGGNGVDNPYSTAGGVAYVDAFGMIDYATYRPAWVYFDNLGSEESYIAEAASHEAGHNMGLSHDGKTDGSAYYGGHGSGDTSWGPIMGTGYGRNVSQWSKGDYYLANNTEDDLTIIAGKLSYRADDHGNTAGTATPLVFTGGTNIVSTTPETDPADTNKANKGVIQGTNDVDVFSFSTAGGTLALDVKPWIMPAGSLTRGGNLDVLLELRNSAGALVAANNPALTTTASLQTNLAAGTYYVYVRPTGYGDPMSASPYGYTNYGSLGRYFISGTLTPDQVVDLTTLVYSANFDVNPGWTLEPDWQFGVPTETAIGLTGGYSGANVMGNNLAGDYGSRFNPARYATTPPISCVGATGLSLRFQRWLGLDNGDTATIEISTNASTWEILWSAPGTVADTGWTLQQLPLPASFDGAPSLRVRWGLGSNRSQQATGWNLDDVQVVAAQFQAITNVNVVVSANPPSQGSVAPASGPYPSGTSVQFLATPATYYGFSNWTGSVTSTSNPITVIVSNTLILTANFQPLQTTNAPTPLWWLAANGVTNEFETAVTNLGPNGMRYWESYIAGLAPTNPASQLLLNAAPSGGDVVLTWGAVSGRVYSLYTTTNMLQGFQPLPGAVDLPWTVSRYTNNPASGTYYRLSVKLQ